MFKLRVLVIEDNQEWQELIKDVITALPCDSRFVSNYAAARNALEGNVFDVITLDMELDDLHESATGWPILRMLNRGNYPHLKDTRVIVLSGSGDFQLFPDKVDELRTKFINVERFLWKGSYDWDDKLHETLEKIVQKINARDGSTLRNPNFDVTKLRIILVNNFNETELKSLAVDIDVDYEILPGMGKEDKARELVAYVERRGRLVELVQAIKQVRPFAAIP